MVYNGILLETIGISVMVSIGLLLFFLAGFSLFKRLKCEGYLFRNLFQSFI